LASSSARSRHSRSCGSVMSRSFCWCMPPNLAGLQSRSRDWSIEKSHLNGKQSNFTKFFIFHRKLQHVKDPSLQRMDTSASTNFRRRRFDEYCREFDPCFFGPEDEPYISVRRRPLSNRDTLRDPSFHAPSIHTPSIHTHGHYSIPSRTSTYRPASVPSVHGVPLDFGAPSLPPTITGFSSPGSIQSRGFRLATSPRAATLGGRSVRLGASRPVSVVPELPFPQKLHRTSEGRDIRGANCARIHGHKRRFIGRTFWFFWNCIFGFWS